MIKVIFCLPEKSFSYQFLANWTKLLQTCPDYGISWQTIFIDFARRHKILKQGLKVKYDYLMLIDSDCVFEPEQFKKLLDKMEKNRKIKALTARSLKNDLADSGFTLLRKGVTRLQPLVDSGIVIGYEKTVIWR